MVLSDFAEKLMEISEINIYPVKSLKGISINEALVERRGLEFDRRWMLVDEQGEFITQRENPRMATVSVALKEDGWRVSAAGFADLAVPFEIEGEPLNVRVWQSTGRAVSYPRQINEWFSDVLQKNCRLVFMPDEFERQVNPQFNKNNDIVSFADGYPLLLIGENSLKDLNEKLENRIPMNRFRPNLVVAGSAAFAEDHWKKIRIGSTVFRAAKPCARCVVPTIDQQKGVLTGKEPIKTLAAYRQAKDVFPENYAEFDLPKTAVLFGQNLIPENPGKMVRVGDQVELTDNG